ncbi:MAG: hypothetical protein ACXW3L_00055 [Limisphaerales bacterium]
MAFTDGDVWRPGIGDPTFMGWLTVVAYFGAACLCGRELMKARRINGPREKTFFWATLAILLVFLGFNKQLDLQTLLTLTARRIAIAQGWYENRRIVQIVFVSVVGIAGVFTILAMRLLVWKHRDLRLPLIGFVVLLVFVVARAASFHHIDQLINFRMGWVRMNWVLELGAIALVAWGALIARKQSREMVNAVTPDRLAPAQ